MKYSNRSVEGRLPHVFVSDADQVVGTSNGRKRLLNGAVRKRKTEGEEDTS